MRRKAVSGGRELCRNGVRLAFADVEIIQEREMEELAPVCLWMDNPGVRCWMSCGPTNDITKD